MIKSGKNTDSLRIKKWRQLCPQCILRKMRWSLTWLWCFQCSVTFPHDHQLQHLTAEIRSTQKDLYIVLLFFFFLRILVSARLCSRSQIHLEALWEVKWARLKLTLWVIIFTWSNKGGAATRSQTPADTFGVTRASVNTTNPCRHMYPGSRRWSNNKIRRIHINRGFTSCCLRVWSGANSVSANASLCGHAHWPAV